MTKFGSAKPSITAIVVGGAGMSEFSANSLMNGERNATAVKELLPKQGIRIEHEETGGKVGWSVYYLPDGKGRLVVKRADGTCTEL